MQLTETPLTAEEVLLIKKMSQSYVSEVQDKDPHKKIPYGEGKAIGNPFVQALKNIAKKQG